MSSVSFLANVMLQKRASSLSRSSLVDVVAPVGVRTAFSTILLSNGDHDLQRLCSPLAAFLFFLVLDLAASNFAFASSTFFRL